jgi:hypothetical protein
MPHFYKGFGSQPAPANSNVPALAKELANYFYSVYNVLQINTLEAMYE